MAAASARVADQPGEAGGELVEGFEGRGQFLARQLPAGALEAFDEDAGGGEGAMVAGSWVFGR